MPFVKINGSFVNTDHITHIAKTEKGDVEVYEIHFHTSKKSIALGLQYEQELQRVLIEGEKDIIANQKAD